MNIRWDTAILALDSAAVRVRLAKESIPEHSRTESIRRTLITAQENILGAGEAIADLVEDNPQSAWMESAWLAEDDHGNS